MDADYGGDINSRQSCAGYVFLQAGGPTACHAQYKHMVTLSIAEAEYMAVSHAAKQILWMYSQMEEVGYTQEKPGVLYNDNLGAIALTKNTKHNLHVKHIDIRHHFICECIENGDITVFHVPSANNLADLFTKALRCIAHQHTCVLLHLCKDPTCLEKGECYEVLITCGFSTCRLSATSARYQPLSY